jgi:hypothetical protein
MTPLIINQRDPQPRPIVPRFSKYAASWFARVDLPEQGYPEIVTSAMAASGRGVYASVGMAGCGVCVYSS